MNRSFVAVTPHESPRGSFHGRINFSVDELRWVVLVVFSSVWWFFILTLATRFSPDSSVSVILAASQRRAGTWAAELLARL